MALVQDTATSQTAASGEKSQAAGLICLGLALVCFGSVPVFLKYFTDILDAWTVNGVRYTIGALFWLPFVLQRHRHWQVATTYGIWRVALVPATFNLVGQTLFALAPYYVAASVMGFILRLSFLFTIAFGFWLLPDERSMARRPIFWIGVASIVAGVIVIYGGDFQRQTVSPLGMGLLLATTLCWSIYAVLISKTMRHYSVRLSFGVISIYTAVGLLVIMFARGEWDRLAMVNGPDWIWLILSALVGIAFAHVLLYRAIHILGPIVTFGGSSMAPLVTAAGAFLVLGETLLLVQLAGGVVLLIGCFCLIRAKISVPVRRSNLYRRGTGGDQQHAGSRMGPGPTDG